MILAEQNVSKLLYNIKNYCERYYVEVALKIFSQCKQHIQHLILSIISTDFLIYENAISHISNHLIFKQSQYYLNVSKSATFNILCYLLHFTSKFVVTGYIYRCTRRWFLFHQLFSFFELLKKERQIHVPLNLVLASDSLDRTAKK